MKTLQSILTGGSTSLQKKRTMNDLQKYLSTCLLATAALLGGASPAFAAADAPSQGTAPAVAVPSAALEKVARALTGVLNPAKSLCNQGVGNGPEDEEWGCDPANSNQGYSDRSNDQLGVPGNPGRKGGNK